MPEDHAPPPLHHLRFAPAKAAAAISHMLAWAREEGHGMLDLHTLLKACYFADKRHLNAHWRPIFGATYRAMAYGPVPIEIYEMLKGEPLWLAELGAEAYPWRQRGYHVEATTDAEPDSGALSRSDLAALRAGYGEARRLTFNARTAASHDAAWRRARLGLMSYADMVEPDHPDREAILDALYEDAAQWRL